MRVADHRFARVVDDPTGPRFDAILHHVRDDGIGHLYREVGAVGDHIIHLLRLPDPVWERMGKPTKLSIIVAAGDRQHRNLTLWEER